MATLPIPAFRFSGALWSGAERIESRAHTTRHGTVGSSALQGDDRLSAWHRPGMYASRALDLYTREDELIDQLEKLPSEEEVRYLINLLRGKAVRTVAEGYMIGTINAAKSMDALKVAKSINSWIATAEEMTASPRRRRGIAAARQSRQAQKAV